MIKNRKFWLFIISLVAGCIVAGLGKDPTIVATLYGIYCCGNVGSKWTQKNNLEEK